MVDARCNSSATANAGWAGSPRARSVKKGGQEGINRDHDALPPAAHRIVQAGQLKLRAGDRIGQALRA